MTLQELITEIKRLSPAEQQVVLNELRTGETASPKQDRSSLSRVHGLLKPDGQWPDDQQIDNLRTAYLFDKHE